MISVRGRYAPSPTGPLHLGNARTALVAYLSARSQGDAFVMRVEDLDAPRIVREAVTGNLEELRWLGLEWDEGPDVGGPFGPYKQSARDAFYEGALKKLQAQGKLFNCYLSRKDLREAPSAPHGRGLVYGEEERKRNARCKERKQREGKTPSLRFLVEPQTVTFEDVLAGPQKIDVAAEVGDFVVRRADGLWAYQLAVVVDDITMRINEVARGDDLLTSTGAQLLLYEALGAAPPRYLHVPLLLDTDGERMAKRRGSLTLTALRDAGVKPERVVGLLAFTLGLLDEPAEVALKDLLEPFHPAKLHRHPFRLEPRHLEWLML